MRIHRLLEQIDRIEPWPDAASLLERAGKFEMGLWTAYISAALHEFTFAASAKGVLRSPFNTCYFEFSGDEGASFRTLGCLGLVEDARLYVRCYVELEQDAWGRFAGAAILENGEIHVARDQQHQDVEPEHLSKALLLVASAIAAIQTQTTTLTTMAAPAALNKARAKKGRPPLPAYYVVQLGVPQQAGHRPAIDSYTPKRMHWRRGHLRRLASGLVVSVSPALVGGEDRGFVDHHYRLTPP